MSFKPQGVHGTEQHKLLFKELFETRDYSRHVRPVRNSTTTVKVEMQFFLSQVLDMDETKETLATNVWITLRWKDEFLNWDPTDYFHIEHLKLSSNLVWLPDVYLYDNAATKYEDLWSDEIVSIKYDGTVMWAAPAIIKTHCRLDVTHYPFDEQTCKVMFGPWQHSAMEINVTGKTTDSYFNGNAEWVLSNISAKNNIMSYQIYPDDPEVPYGSVTYTMILRRRPLYYIFNLILPCGFISVTTLMIFFLPADSGEKVGLGITVLLSLTVFLLLVAEILPPSSTVPVIGQYYAATMVLVSLSLAMTVVVLSLHHRGPESGEVPAWTRRLILGQLGRLLLFRKLKATKQQLSKPVTKSANSISSNFSNQGSGVSDSLLTPLNDIDVSNSNAYNVNTDSNSHNTFGRRNKRIKSGNSITVNINDEHLRILKKMHLEMRSIADYFKLQTREADKHCEWKQVAMVVDRLFMFCYIIGSVATCLIIICQVYA
ncbi:neuronal acetylcholine receptor subunit alpha-10-like [Glandiceps talaboti]